MTTATNLGTYNYTLDVNDGDVGLVQVIPVAGYTTYAAWTISPDTAQLGVDYTANNEPTYVELPAGGEALPITILTHVHNQDDFNITVFYYYTDQAGDAYTATYNYNVIIAADDLGIPVVSSAAENMPSQLNFQPVGSASSGEYISPGYSVNSSDAWTNATPGLPSSYSSGTSQQLNDYMGEGAERGLQNYLAPYLESIGAQDALDVGQIVAKTESNFYGDFQNYINAFSQGNASLDQLDQALSNHVTEFDQDVSNYLNNKLGSIANGIAAPIIKAVNTAATAVNYIESVFGFSLSAQGASASSSVVNVEKGLVFQPGATIVVDDAQSPLLGGDTASDVIWAGTGDAVVQFLGSHNIAEIVGDGHYTVEFQGNSSQYGITLNSTAQTLEVTDEAFGSARDGENSLFGVNFLQFHDKTIVVGDSDTVSIALLYEAALGRTPDILGQSTWEDIYANNVPVSVKGDLFVSLAETSGGYNGSLSIAQGFVVSTEFQQKYGSLTNQQFITLMYENVLGRAPDSAGNAEWNKLMTTGDPSVEGGHVFTQAMVLVGFADSAENVQTQIAKGWLIEV